MAIVIKKRVSLEFLGEEYKEAYLVFKSIPVKDLGKYQTQVAKTDEKDTSSIVDVFTGILKSLFVEGEFPDGGSLKPVAEDDLGDLDSQSIITCFKILSGQELDPKVPTPSTSTSLMVDPPPTSS